MTYPIRDGSAAEAQIVALVFVIAHDLVQDAVLRQGFERLLDLLQLRIAVGERHRAFAAAAGERKRGDRHEKCWHDSGSTHPPPPRRRTMPGRGPRIKPRSSRNRAATDGKQETLNHGGHQGSTKDTKRAQPLIRVRA